MSNNKLTKIVASADRAGATKLYYDGGSVTIPKKEFDATRANLEITKIVNELLLRYSKPGAKTTVRDIAPTKTRLHEYFHGIPILYAVSEVGNQVSLIVNMSFEVTVTPLLNASNGLSYENEF